MCQCGCNSENVLDRTTKVLNSSRGKTDNVKDLFLFAQKQLVADNAKLRNVQFSESKFLEKRKILQNRCAYGADLVMVGAFSEVVRTELESLSFKRVSCWRRLRNEPLKRT